MQLEYRPPAGSSGRGIAWLFGEEPEQQIREDLRRVQAAAGDRRDPAVGWSRPVACRAARARRPNRSATCAGVQLMKANCWHGTQERPGRTTSQTRRS